MLCFDVFRNGEHLCRAGIQDARVLSAMLTWVANSPQAGRRKARTKKGDLRLHVGGLHHPEPGQNAHPAWIDQDLNRGDEIVIRIVNAASGDKPHRVTVSSKEELEQHQRAYYEEMKKKYESEAPRKASRVGPSSKAKAGRGRGDRGSAK